MEPGCWTFVASIDKTSVGKFDIIPLPGPAPAADAADADDTSEDAIPVLDPDHDED